MTDKRRETEEERQTKRDKRRETNEDRQAETGRQ